MRRRTALGVAASVVFLSIAAALAGSIVKTDRSAAPAVTADIDARRVQLVRRVEEGRRAGQLRGLGYMELLGRQQKLLVAQRRIEAEGKISAEVHAKFMADLDRLSVDIDFEIGKSIARATK